MTTKDKYLLPKIDLKKRQFFSSSLLNWYKTHKRPLPWRVSQDPYAITVSEYMCQQTQVATVIPYFERWMKSFPTWKALAEAPAEKILKHWEGLGYYRRARALHHVAQQVMERFEGILPKTTTELQDLKGIGPYTAGAIASIAFDQSVPLVDGNVERVFARFFGLEWNFSEPAAHKKAWELATLLVPEKHAGDYNQSIMELGAIICTPRNPQCLICPINTQCVAKNNDPNRLPIKNKTIAVLQQEDVAVIYKKNKILLRLPNKERRWHDFHQLPAFDAGKMIKKEQVLKHVYGITKYRVTANVFEASLKKEDNKAYAWINLEQLSQITLPAPHRKILEKFFSLKSFELP
jgi:A/G-specific adenine glycosylase